MLNSKINTDLKNKKNKTFRKKRDLSGWIFSFAEGSHDTDFTSLNLITDQNSFILFLLCLLTACECDFHFSLFSIFFGHSLFLICVCMKENGKKENLWFKCGERERVEGVAKAFSITIRKHKIKCRWPTNKLYTYAIYSGNNK